MSESGDSHIEGEDTQGHESSVQNTAPLFAVHVENLQVADTQDNDDEAEPGDQNNDRRRLNTRVDSAMYKQGKSKSSVTIDGLCLEETRHREKSDTGPRRRNTAPINRSRTEIQQSLLPTSTNTTQGIPETSESEELAIKSSCMCGLFQCKSTETMWKEGGSLRRMSNNEEVIVQKAARFGDCFRIYSVLSFIVVTNRRFTLKQSWNLGPFNFLIKESSHNFANIQHVGVERGIGIFQTFRKIIIFIALIFFSLSPMAFAFLTTSLQLLFFVSAVVYGTHNLIYFLIRYCTSIVVIDVAKKDIVGSWQWSFFTRGSSYLTLVVPLPIDACFEVMNELMNKDPLLSQPEEDV